MKKQVFEELCKSVQQGVVILRGELKPERTFVFPEPNTRSIREQYRLSQEKFATLLGINVATLRNWEQGRRKPEGAARVLLRIVAKHPEVVFDVFANKE